MIWLTAAVGDARSGGGGGAMLFELSCLHRTCIILNPIADDSLFQILHFPRLSCPTWSPCVSMEDPIASSNLATAGKPSQTIYVNNLNEKIKLPKLKQTLASTFRPLGNILEVIALSNVRTPVPASLY